jgi:hypothetical protein
MSVQELKVLVFAMLFGALLLAYITGRLAKRRGRSFNAWWWLSMLCGPYPFALLVLMLLPRKKETITINGDVAP